MGSQMRRGKAGELHIWTEFSTRFGLKNKASTVSEWPSSNGKPEWQLQAEVLLVAAKTKSVVPNQGGVS